ncbi:MAG: DASS family sodium-coupled anion symporter [Steroidobacteraceae bacterium]
MSEEIDEVDGATPARGAVQHAGLVAGGALLLAVLLLPAPAGWSAPAWHTAGITLLMGVWWATEALPLAATALVPVALLPMLGAGGLEAIGGAYGNSTVFLILGGFLVALAMERWNLHKRLAYSVVVRAGDRPRLLVLGMMVATAFVSMWASNTSTTLMMIPVALSIAAVSAPDPATATRGQRNFAAAIVLGVAWGATIGGLGTLVGTPTNALVAGFMRENYGYTIGFTEWLAFGLPTVFLLLPLAWLVLVRFALPFELGDQRAAGAAVERSLAELGPMSRAERRVAALFVVTAVVWIARPLLTTLPGLSRLNDAGIALTAGLALFVIPSGARGEALLSAPALRRVPWPVLLLFGGGLALAAAIQDSGLSALIAGSLTGLAGLPLVGLTLAIVVLLVFWTEINSNVAAAATFAPILAALAAATHHPPLLLVAPAAMAASCGFMLPVGTPPNAIVYGTGRVTMRDMMRAGFAADLLAVGVITLVATLVLPYLAR